MTAITLETLEAALHAFQEHGIETEVSEVSVARTSAVGSYHMLKGQNPVFVITGNCHE